jgi:hypothetical protein
MRGLLSICWDIALWRRSPRDLPASWTLLGAVALPYVLAGIAQAELLYGPSLALERALVDLGLTGVVVWACLAVRDRGYRAMQTLAAVLATSCLITLPMLALLLLVQAIGRESPLGQALAFGLLPLQIWYLFVLGRIVRLALDAPLLAGMAVALGYALCSDFVQAALPRALAG